MPVYHRGYRDFLAEFKDAQTCLVIDEAILKKEDYLRKDLRSLTVDEQVDLLRALGIFDSVQKASLDLIKNYDKPGTTVIFPDEDVSRIAAEHFKEAKIVFYPVFLRWNRNNINEAPRAEKHEKTTSYIS